MEEKFEIYMTISNSLTSCNWSPRKEKRVIDRQKINKDIKVMIILPKRKETEQNKNKTNRKQTTI